MKKLNSSVAALVAVVLLSGCGATIRYAKPPEIYSVKKVAIVSLYSNASVYNLEGGGQLTALAGFIAKKSGSQNLVLGGTKLVEYALGVFSEELGKVGGWQVVPEQSFMESAEYKAFAEKKTGGLSKTLGELSYTCAPGMFAATDVSSSYATEEFGKLARELNVDAVAVIQLDLAYQPWTSAFGSGTAKAAVAAQVAMISGNGKYALLTEQIEKGKGRRENSDDQVGMVSGELVYSDKVEEIFKDATKKIAGYYAAAFKADLEKLAKKKN